MTTIHYTWDELNDCYLMESDESGASSAIYTNEPVQFGTILSQRRGATTNYYHFDAQQSTRQLTAAGGNATDTYDFSGFGNTLSASGTTTNSFRYGGAVGYHFDPAHGAIYIRSRFYDPEHGRWLSCDPIGLAGDTNLYRYARNNPILYVDPVGNWVWPWDPNADWVWPWDPRASWDPRDTWRLYWSGICNIADSRLLRSDLATCVCGIAGIADLFSMHPLIEWFDCLCNILQSVQLLCDEKYLKGACYIVTTGFDCASPQLGALFGCEAGAAIGWPGGVGGAIVGCFIGVTFGDTIIDVITWVIQNMINQDGNPLPFQQWQACMRVLDA